MALDNQAGDNPGRVIAGYQVLFHTNLHRFNRALRALKKEGAWLNQPRPL